MTDLIGHVARVGRGGGAGEVTVGEVLRTPLLAGGRERVIITRLSLCLYSIALFTGT